MQTSQCGRRELNEHRPPLRESEEPVLKHVKLYRGTDPLFTSALETYGCSRAAAALDRERVLCTSPFSEMLT